MKRGAVHHVDLSVADPDASRPFYEAVLGFMGYVHTGDEDRYEPHENGFDMDLRDSEGLICSIGLLRARGANAGRGHDRYSPGLHHIAWYAPSREDVDAMHALLVEIGANVLDAPAEYPKYGPGYYAVFFTDPDGLKLEYVYKP
jgi:catechol 2,3-dioxygenase-like lactoylglutathione lyase family enzyme